MERLLEYNRKDLRNWAGEELAAQFFDNRSKYPAPYNNLDYWISKSNPDALKDYMDKYKSKNQQKKEIMMDGAEKIYDDGRWLVVLCKTYDAMKFYGKGTKWCIAGNYPGHEGRGKEYFDSYKSSRYSDYYVFIDREGQPGYDKWCVCPYKSDPSQCDIWDAPDNTTSAINGAPTIKGLPYVSNVIIEGDTLVKVKNVRGSRSTAFSIPDTVKHIARKAFYGCDYGVIHIPDSVVSIGSGAFARNDFLSELNIPGSVTETGTAIAFDCGTMRRVSVPASITKLTKNMFAFCDNLQDIKINGVIDEIDNSWVDGSRNVVIYFDDSKNEKLVQWVKYNHVEAHSVITGEILSERG